MKMTISYRIHHLLVWILFSMVTIGIQADNGDVLDRKIQLSKSKNTRYKLLRQVSDLTGYLFVYDSEVVENDKVVKISQGEYTLRNAINAITGNDQLRIEIVGNHILLYRPDKNMNELALEQKQGNTSSKFFSIRGTVYDRISNQPIAYSSIGVSNTTIGTIANQNGEFELILPDSLEKHTIRLSHVGYDSEDFEASLLSQKNIKFTLEPKVVTLQEIIVRAVDPLEILQDMLVKRSSNYSKKPCYLTAFYREGIDHKKKNIDLTEAVLKIYKTGNQSKSTDDQVKLIKMRHILSEQDGDTIFTKMKSGIQSCLMLDIVKDLPEFIDYRNNETSFVYSYSDISFVNNRRVYVISFKPNADSREPKYRGELFIDSENRALVEARFEINPEYIEKATDMFIERKSKDLKLTLQQAGYTVSYKQTDDGIYYINHIRGDVEFKAKKKRRLFSTSLHLWFEMVNCKIDTVNVTAFPRNERLSTRKIFSETQYSYDKNFWENFNTILPEDRLKEVIVRNLSEVIDARSANE